MATEKAATTPKRKRRGASITASSNKTELPVKEKKVQAKPTAPKVEVKKTTPKKADTEAKKNAIPKKRKKRLPGITASRFFDPVVLVLGRKTEFKANVPVDHKEILDEILKVAALTDEEMALADEAAARSSEPGTITYLHRRIGFGFRNRRAGYVTNIEPLTTQMGTGQWALTEAGAEKAKELEATVSSETTETTATASEVEAPTETTATASEVEAASGDDLPPEAGSTKRVVKRPERKTTTKRKGRSISDHQAA